MHVLSTFRCICFLLALSVLVGLGAAIAVAENEGPSRGDRATLRGPADPGLQSTVDWTALFLAEFAAGGAIENRYLLCDCDRICRGDGSECPVHRHQPVDEEEATAGDEKAGADAELTIESLWDRSRVFADQDAGDDTRATDGGRASVADSEARASAPVVRCAPETAADVRAEARNRWRGSGQEFRHPLRCVPGKRRPRSSSCGAASV
jgi:hypothetical protein